MSKVLVFFIEAITIVASVVIISIFGINPELSGNTIYMNSINFTCGEMVNQDGTMVRQLKLPTGTTEYQLTWTISPTNATYPYIRFTCLNNYVTINNEGRVTFAFPSGAETGVIIKVLTQDGSGLSDTITILFDSGGSGDIEL